MSSSFFITVPKGAEDALAEELKELSGPYGFALKDRSRGGVSVTGDLRAAYAICLHSRIATRVLMPLKSFPAPNPEKLYGGVKSIRWTDHIDARGTLAVDFSSSRSQITHTQFGAQKTKDAICDQLKSIHGERPSVEFKTPDVRVNVYVHENLATVSLDLSGSSLHERGYRAESRLAPLKENLAATLLRLAGYAELVKQGGALVDPMCGSGTFCIEAALMATRSAPGLNRPYFGFLKWKGHQPDVWKALLKEANEMQVLDRKLIPPIVGYDQDPRAIAAAIDNARGAGMHPFVHFEKRELNGAEPPPRGEAKGLFIVNPPYGERLGEVEALKPTYRAIGDLMKKKFKGWQAAVFTGSLPLTKEVGLKASKKHVLFNGPIECRLMTYDLY